MLYELIRDRDQKLNKNSAVQCVNYPIIPAPEGKITKPPTNKTYLWLSCLNKGVVLLVGLQSAVVLFACHQDVMYSVVF